MKWKKDSKSMANEAFYWNFSVIIQSQNVKSDTAVASATLYSSSQSMNMQNIGRVVKLIQFKLIPYFVEYLVVMVPKSDYLRITYRM